jgi:2-polyprenyl-3-methyl-5-hydroxy-6-metoxy-1,4-benzoquinol methylase
MEVVMTGYVFEASDLLDEQRKYMQQSLDPMTIARLEALGVGPGWRCLEVGGGGGSIVRWLGERVGDTGRVLVTDVDTGGLESAGNVTVRRHDIVDEELPDGGFDLVHARLVLLHLAQRDRALTRMARTSRFASARRAWWWAPGDLLVAAGAGPVTGVAVRVVAPGCVVLGDGPRWPS